MSIRVKFDELDEKNKNFILKTLKFVEDQTFANKDDALARISFFIYKDGYIHLPFYFATRIIPNSLDFNTEKRTFKIEPFKMLPNFSLRDNQKVIMSEAMDLYKKNRTVCLELACGAGKTCLATAKTQYFSTMGLRSLIIMPLTLVRESWVGTYGEFTDAKIYVVGKDKGPVPSDVQVIISLDQSVRKLSEEELATIGFVVFDEIHMLCTSRKVATLLATQPSYVCGLSATLRKGDTMTKIIPYLVGPKKITRIEEKAFTVYKINTGFVPEGFTRSSRGVNFGSVIQALSAIPERNDLICRIIKKEMGCHKILVVVQHVDHGKLLQKKFKEDLGIDATFIHGAKKTYIDSRVLIGTLKKVSTGFDQAFCGDSWDGVRLDMLVLTSSMKDVEQTAGRVFRSVNPFLIDMVDNFRNCKSHYTLRKKWYGERNSTIINKTY